MVVTYIILYGGKMYLTARGERNDNDTKGSALSLYPSLFVSLYLSEAYVYNNMCVLAYKSRVRSTPPPSVSPSSLPRPAFSHRLLGRRPHIPTYDNNIIYYIV